MAFASKKIQLLGREFVLTNQRAIFCKSLDALILSDLHIGKTAHFRRHGIAVPNHIFKKDLHRFSSLIDYFKPKKIYIVGDLLHAGDNADVDFFCEWKSNFHDIEFHLAKGNHDRISVKLEEKLCLNSVAESYDFGDFSLVHDFDFNKNQFQITGHIHPGIYLRTAVKSFRLPCFALTEKQLLLPAFSEFTGLDTQNTPREARFFPFTNDEIFEL